MTVLLSLLAAASYGLGDFNGGIFSKRGGAWAVSLVAQLAGTVLVLAVALVDGGGGDQAADHEDTPAEVVAGPDRPEVPRQGVVPPAPRQPTAQPALPGPR